MLKSNDMIDILQQMKSDTLHNYVIAGLDSSLLENGKVRLFECSRNHYDFITPHSHRFDIVCLVLQGTVWNTLWTKVPDTSKHEDLFQLSQVNYKGKPGEYTTKPISRDRYSSNCTRYVEGDTYSMKAEEIHSISFSKNAKVLFFEGPEVCNHSHIIEPVVNDKVILTFETKNYMFQSKK